MDSLRLTYPAQQQGQHLLVETRPDQLKHWLEALPFGDMRRTVPQVSQAIASLNRSEMSHQQRAELNALFDHTYELISDYYRPRIMMRPRGQQFASRSEGDELQLLTREMAFAYKLLVTETIEKRSFWSKKDKPLAKALNLATHYLGLILLEHYETYSPVPVYIWRELNAIYGYAARNELDQMESLESDYRHCLPTVDDSYIRICLVALANPYQMDRGEHWEMNKFLGHWGGLARLSDDPDDFTKRNCFVVDLASENKPNYGVNALEDPEDPNLRLLVTQELTAKIGYLIAQLETERKLPQPGFFPGITEADANNLMQRMQSHWDFRVERIAPRYPIINQLDVIWGLNKSHAVLTAQDPLSPNASAEIREGSREVLAAMLGEQPGQLRWDAVNASDGGICIAQHYHSVEQLRIGQLAALREYIDGKPSQRWQLGIVRWLRGDKRKGTSLGLQYIKGELQAVMIRARKGNRIETSWQPALLLSGEEMHGLSSPTVVSQRGLYADGRPLQLQIGLETLSVRARMRVEVTPLIERYFYQVYIHEEEQTDDTGENGENVSLDNVPLPGDH